MSSAAADSEGNDYPVMEMIISFFKDRAGAADSFFYEEHFQIPPLDIDRPVACFADDMIK